MWETRPSFAPVVLRNAILGTTVTAKSPGLIPDQVPEEVTWERGKEKKQRLLAYLREHPEELRPAVI